MDPTSVNCRIYIFFDFALRAVLIVVHPPVCCSPQKMRSFANLGQAAPRRAESPMERVAQGKRSDTLGMRNKNIISTP